MINFLAAVAVGYLIGNPQARRKVENFIKTPITNSKDKKEKEEKADDSSVSIQTSPTASSQPAPKPIVEKAVTPTIIEG